MRLRGRVGRTVDGTGECSTLRAVRVCVCAWECAMSIISAISTRCSLPRLAVALAGLFAVTLIAVVATGPRTASAQPPAAIEETELILRWRENAEVGSWNSFHWGGGTVRKLLDRLIQNGCAVDADVSSGRLFKRTGRGWESYVLLNDRASARGVSSRDINMPPGTLIRGMLDTVRRGTYTVWCVAGCGILRSGKDDVSRLEDCPSQFDRRGLTQASQVRSDWGREERNYVPPPGATDPNSANGLCWPLDHQRLATWRLHLVIPYFAIHPGTCLLRESQKAHESGVAGGTAWPAWDRWDAPPVLALYERPAAGSELNDVPLAVTVHEYCHANQFWHMQRSVAKRPWLDEVSKSVNGQAWSFEPISAWWAYATPAGRAFVEAVGMRWNDTEGWTVPSFPFNVMYRSDPMELAAEVCVEYLSKILEIDSHYAWATWSEATWSDEIDDYTAIVDGLDVPGIADPSGSNSGTFFDRPERYDWDSGAVLTAEVIQWLNDWVLLPHVDPGSGRRPTNLGECEEDMRVGLGQSCWVRGAPETFEVPNGKGGKAWSPCDQRTNNDLNVIGIKVETWDSGQCGSLPGDWTFQAERVGDAWFVRAVGPWEDVGMCRRGSVVRPGRYCTVPRLGERAPRDPTPVRFYVYAVDELNPDDTRALYSKGGYAVLYYWPNHERPDPDNGRLHHGRVEYVAVNGFHFKAEKKRLRGEWEVTLAR